MTNSELTFSAKRLALSSAMLLTVVSGNLYAQDSDLPATIVINNGATDDTLTNLSGTNTDINSTSTQNQLANDSSDQVSVENNTEDDAFNEGFDDGFGFDDANANNVSEVNDPLIGYNRFMFNINLGLDNHVVRPMTDAYKDNTPTFIQNGVSNFFFNIKEPWTAINLLLQGRFVASLETLARFGVNTVTTLGFGDPAYNVLNLTRYEEDFGQTLGVWGVPAGPYLVLPFYGPSSVRDAGTRLFVDTYGDPKDYIKNTPTRYTVLGASAINKRKQLMKYEGVFEPTYEVVRDAYLQKRDYDINGFKTDEAVNPADQDSANDSFDEGFGD